MHVHANSASSIATSGPALAGDPTTRLPELLAPAGDWECARAAVENGADAIYFGLEKFNARMRAHNFTEADLPELMKFLHRRGVKGFVTFNILVFENEMADAEHYLRAVIAAGVDAAIVQDVGICRLIRQISPDFPIHVSTQMTVTSAAGLEFARELGANRVVLARECSLKEIGQIHAATALPLEVFVHGALCVAYSGQCLTSEALGGRSANRGECAQACRLPYELISDGALVPLGDRKYLLSPQDLAGLEALPDLVRAGVSSLKIEGRLKSPEYVANITRVYRGALDRMRAQEFEKGSPSPRPSPPGEGDASNAPGSRYGMEMAFSRGLYTGWLRGINNQQLVHARFGKKRGVFLGEVSEVRRDGVVVPLAGPLKPGDGVVFDAGKPAEDEEGGRVYEVSPLAPSRGKPLAKAGTLIRFGRDDINFSRIHVGDKLWKTSDPALDKQLRNTFAGDVPKYHRAIFVEVHGTVGKPLRLMARDEMGNGVELESAMPLVAAERQPLTKEKLEEQLGRLGGTPFKLGGLESHLVGEVVLPVSELNRLRREVVARLDERRSEPQRWTIRQMDEGEVRPHPGPLPQGEGEILSDSRTPSRLKPGLHAELTVLVRSLAQLEAALAAGLEMLYCEFEDPKKYREAVEVARKAAHRSAIFVAPPRIFKTGEEWILKQVRSSNADGYLVRNYDHLRYFAGERCVGDYSLNIANRLTAEYFKNRFSLERITASYDLNFTQLEALLQASPAEWFEITLHQHIPMFHMEHCVFCAFLSEGTDYTNCGRPCDHHEVKLRDRVGAAHPLKADAGCRNTVFNSRAQTGAEHFERMQALGARNFRIEFLGETPDEVTETLGRYRQLLRGEITGAQLWRELKLVNQLGVTRGQINR